MIIYLPNCLRQIVNEQLLKVSLKSFYSYIRSKFKIKERVGPLTDDLDHIITDDSEMSKLLNDFIGSADMPTAIKLLSSFVLLFTTCNLFDLLLLSSLHSTSCTSCSSLHYIHPLWPLVTFFTTFNLFDPLLLSSLHSTSYTSFSLLQYIFTHPLIFHYLLLFYRAAWGVWFLWQG